MNIEKVETWNWFIHEEGGNGGGLPVSVSRARVDNLRINCVF